MAAAVSVHARLRPPVAANPAATPTSNSSLDIAGREFDYLHSVVTVPTKFVPSI